MARRMEWERARSRESNRLRESQSKDKQLRTARSQEEADKLAVIIEEAKAAKRAGRFYNMPKDISPEGQKLCWARAFFELKGVARR